jgi:SWI/SNF-related matrix-associated actin-dependent regulator of chromatin subfamily B protein 1
MKLLAVDKAKGTVVPLDQLPQKGSLPDTMKYQYQPRIKCNDCPGKLYTAGVGQTVDNFEVHLKNRLHKERVEQRKKTK